MIEILYDKIIDKKLDSHLLENAARTALKNQSAPEDATLSILLTDDEQIKTLNRDYRGYDSPTDVLSFDVHERDPETGLLYLGEIILSIPYAAKQAKEHGHLLEAEVQLLIVHGVLHLLGHDHAEATEKEKMWTAQSKILTELGLEKIKIQEI
ncbi:MAG: rRNA maturation RNase YbeY [Anaerolineae bacterium]|jgi:probable rRNA maturation factor|nr:rRNA maturation RNase YbeY [Anaerolineae bacterium]MBT7075994.1 rRNA maturation RNase YbeY [Anaerolineae bacterium]MBT7783731.1 rRNA maturation RNase YbeY [Anaerolineae bacterium]